MAEGYNSPRSTTWHSEQRCSGTRFSAMEAMSSTVARNRGLSPCVNCCGGEWPDNEEAEGRGPGEWLSEIADGETAVKLTSRMWRGPEWVTTTDEGAKLVRHPVGMSGDQVSVSSDVAQFESDIEDPGIDARTVPVEETPLADIDYE